MGTILGGPLIIIIRIIVFWGLYWSPSIMETDIDLTRTESRTGMCS